MPISLWQMMQIWDFDRPSTRREKNKINLWFSLLWKSPFLQHQQECDAGWMWVQDSPSVMLANVALFLCFFTDLCLCESSLRQRSSFFLYSRVWNHNQLLCASIRLLKLHVALVLGFCLQVNYIRWDLSMGQGFMLWRWGKGNDLGNSCALHLTLPTHFVLSVQQFLRPMLRTRIGNWSGFMKKKVAKEWSCVFTAGPLSKVSDPCTIKGVHCSKWMGTSSSTGLSVGTSMADLLKHCLEVMLLKACLPSSFSFTSLK